MVPRRRLDPFFPQAGETKRFATFQHHAERLPFPLAFLPLIKTVGGNQAAPMLERLAERIPAGQRFRPRIDVRVADAFIFLSPRTESNPSA